MSISRFTTRMLALSALMPQPGDTDAITMVGDKVFDSRLDPLAFNRQVTQIPAIVVYTDDDTSTIQTRAANVGPFHRICTLRVEIAVGSFDTITHDGKDYTVFATPSTDPELEAKLDLLEQQVKWALLDWIDRPATVAFRKWVVRFEQIASHPDRDEASNNKLASRRLLFSCVIRDDCPPRHVIVGQTEERSGINSKGAGGLISQPPHVEVVTSIPTGKQKFTAADFPNAPWLADMFVAMQDAPSYRPVLDVLVGNGEPQIFLPILKRLGSNIDCIFPADPNLLAKLGRKSGPDGRVEAVTLWEIPN